LTCTLCCGYKQQTYNIWIELQIKEEKENTLYFVPNKTTLSSKVVLAFCTINLKREWGHDKQERVG
jgi:hypothetical protein